MARRIQDWHAACGDSVSSAPWPLPANAKMKSSPKMASIDWTRSDYDPYARTKKFCEHMVRELLPDVQKIIFRPSIVLGDTRYGATTQFDMVRAFVFLAGLPVLPLRPDDRIEIIPVDYVAKAIATLHQKENPRIRHLSPVVRHRLRNLHTNYRRYRERVRQQVSPMYAPSMARPFNSMVNVNRKSPRRNRTRRRRC